MIIGSRTGRTVVPSASTQRIGHLDHAEIQQLREREHLDVEREALALHQVEEQLGRLGAEGLEPALRVRGDDAGERAREAVEELALDLAQAAVPDVRDLGAGDGPGAEDHVGVVERTHEAGQIGEIRREIGVHEDQTVVAGHAHAGLDRPALALVPRDADEPGGRPVADVRRDHVGGAVTAAVVDEDDLDVAVPPELGTKLRNRLREPPSLVVGRNDQAGRLSRPLRQWQAGHAREQLHLRPPCSSPPTNPDPPSTLSDRRPELRSVILDVTRSDFARIGRFWEYRPRRSPTVVRSGGAAPDHPVAHVPVVHGVRQQRDVDEAEAGGLGHRVGGGHDRAEPRVDVADHRKHAHRME